LLLLATLKTLAGLGLLLFGGELLLRGAVALARRFGLSKLLIGLTVVAAATSAPELIVVLWAGLQGVPDLGVGNVVGSNIANVLLILGTAAVIFPILTGPTELLRDGLAVAGASLLLLVFAFLGTWSWPHGLLFLILLAGYMAFSYRSERKRRPAGAGGVDAEDEAEAAALKVPLLPPRLSAWAGLSLIVVGMAGMVLGSELLVDGAVVIARAAGVSDSAIGLTLVAVGTSLPELATAVIAALRRHTEVALGNVLGSNLFNIFACLGALSLAVPFQVSAEVRAFDIWVMAGVSLLLLPVMFTGWRIGRGEGALFLLLYAGYIAAHFYRGALPG